MVFQLSPAWPPSRIRNSNSNRSSCTGTPHSRSWYVIDNSFVAHGHRCLVDFIASLRQPVSLSQKNDRRSLVARWSISRRGRNSPRPAIEGLKRILEKEG